MRSRSMTIGILFLIIMLFFPANSLHADIGDFDYEGGDLRPTEQQKGNTGPGDHEHGDIPGSDVGSPSWLDELWDTLRGVGKDVIDGISNAWNAGTECVSDIGNCANNIGDWFSKTLGDFTNWVSDIWGSFTDWTSDVWNGFTDWVSDVWDSIPAFFQDFIKTLLVIVGVVGAIIILIKLGVIGLVAGVVAAVVASIVALVYWLITGGTDSFNVWHLLGLTVLAAAGGWAFVHFEVGSLIASFFRMAGPWVANLIRTAFTRSVGFIKRAFVMSGRFIASVARSVWGGIKWLGGKIAAGFSKMWASKLGKVIIITEASSFVYNGVKVFTGQMTIGELIMEQILAAATVLAGGVIFRFAKQLTSVFQKLAVYLIPGILGAITSGLASFITTGEITIDDLFIGFSIGSLGVVIELTIARYIPENIFAEVAFEGANLILDDLLEWGGRQLEIGQRMWDGFTLGIDIIIDLIVDTFNTGFDWLRGLFNR